MAVEAISKTNKQQIDELTEKEAINHDGRLINKTLSNYKMHQYIRPNLHPFRCYQISNCWSHFAWKQDQGLESKQWQVKKGHRSAQAISDTG